MFNSNFIHNDALKEFTECGKQYDALSQQEKDTLHKKYREEREEDLKRYAAIEESGIYKNR